MKFDRQLRPASESLWVVSYGGKTTQRLRKPPFWKSICRHISAQNHPIFLIFCTQQQILNLMKSRDQKRKFPKFKTADGCHFENCYIAISQRRIIQFSWNFVHSSRFWTGWTSHDQKWKSCIGQTPSLTELISCVLCFYVYVITKVTTSEVSCIFYNTWKLITDNFWKKLL